MEELIKDLKQALIEMRGVVGEIHDNGENCPFCGADIVDPGPEYAHMVCDNDDCIDNKASAVMHRANVYLLLARE